MKRYILNAAGEPVLCRDLEEWTTAYARDPRRVVAQDHLGHGVLYVSTVFLGLDHNVSGRGPPVLYETMLFGADELDSHQWRYTTRAEALRGHEAVLELAKTMLARTQAVLNVLSPQEQHDQDDDQDQS